VYVGGLAELPNPNASITNPFLDVHTADVGVRVYGRQCVECHGENARGGTGPDLVAAVGTMTDWAFFSSVKWGRSGTIMRAQPLSDTEIWQVHAFVRQRAIEMTVGKHSHDGELPPFPAVTFDALRDADSSSDWLTYSGNYAGFRHARQTQISNRNVQNLRLVWAAQLTARDSALESTPVVVGGRMFVTESPEGLTALDAKTGTVLWEFRRPAPSGILLCCGSSNRGVAVLDDMVFVETLDAHLIAFDAATGAKRWETEVANWHDGYSMTGAPLAMKDQIVIGVAGGDMGIRGFIAAYSPKDGSLRWKFDTIPGPGQPGNETWEGDSWKHGGAATWTTGTYDPTLGLIYWGTGNPAPDFTVEGRAGSNLYASSLVAIDAQTGKLRWYFQFEPADTHDWDAVQEPVLADIPWHGKLTPVLMQANRNGFFYVLNRQTGEFLLVKQYAKQTWASGFDVDGHPIVRSGSKPSHKGTLVWPSAGGATNWWPPSFDPHRRLLFVPAVDGASLFFQADKVPQFSVGEDFGGSSTQRAANQPYFISLRAIDVATGELRWEAPLAAGGPETRTDLGGVLSTDGDLVFTGSGNELLAMDADTGKKLWVTPLGGATHAPPITYTMGDQQYVTVIAGRSVFTFALPSTHEDSTAYSSTFKKRADRP